MKNSIQIIVNNKSITCQSEQSVLEACLEAGIYIPHLCYHPDLPAIGECDLCAVTIQGSSETVNACKTMVSEGMDICTDSEDAINRRLQAMKKILKGHPADCGTCVKYLNCELQSLKQYFSDEALKIEEHSKNLPVNTSNPLFNYDPNKCVLCRRCVRACHDLRGVGVLTLRKLGEEEYIGTEDDALLADAGCRFCGACAEVCPTGAILEKKELTEGKKRNAVLTPCRYTCPAETDVPRYIAYINQGDYESAKAVIRERAPFPGLLGHVCTHPCEDVCKRGQINESVSIRNLKRFAAEQSTGSAWLKRSIRKNESGQKVAVIGSGPAGMTAAYYLNRQGHEVTIFEERSQAGGMLRYGIPEYRLPRTVIDDEIQIITNLGVNIITNHRVEDIDDLLDDDFEAVIVAVGAQIGSKIPLPGAKHPRVYAATDFLRTVNSDEDIQIGQQVLVLGGGNVAFDVARLAVRLGAKEVAMACLESENAMLASPEEIEQGIEEGIQIFPSRSFTDVLIRNDRIIGVKCVKISSLEIDEETGLRFDVLEGSDHVIPADMVIFAVGQKPDIPDEFDLDLTDRGLIDLDEYTHTTSRDEVFAAGDAVLGTTSVIQSIASGRKAAIAADRYLGGDGDISEKLADEFVSSCQLGRLDDFASLPRARPDIEPVEKRQNDFALVERTFTREMAEYESSRCLKCYLRKDIQRVRFWGDYESILAN